MKRKYVYIIVSLFIIVFMSVTTLYKNSNMSYSFTSNPASVCAERGFSYEPMVTVHMYDSYNGGMTRTFYKPVVSSSLLPQPTAAGFRFLGWYYGGSLLNYTVPSFTVPVNQEYGAPSYIRCYKRVDISVEARWESACVTPKSPTVSFVSNGGSSVSSTTVVTVNAMYNNGQMPTPTRSGYMFDGWYINPELTVPYNGSNIVIRSYTVNGCPQQEAKLYAKWQAVTVCPKTGVYNLHFNSNGGSYIATQERMGVASEVSFNLSTPTKSGYVFQGWYRDSALSVKANNTVSGISFSQTTINGCPVYVGTVYAKWAKEPEKTIEPSQPRAPSEPTPVTPVTPQKPTTPSSGGTGEKTVNVCPNVINTLSISFDTKGGSQVDDVNICLTCEQEEITLPTPSLEGKNFVGWYSDEKLENEVIVNGLNTDIQLSQFKLVVDKDENGCDSDVAKTVLYARYEEATCNTPDIANIDINFVSGEDNPIENVRSCLDCDDEFSELPILKREGYLFGGWYIDADYSRLVNKKINLDNAVKYMNVTRNFENECSTDTISTILYAKWIPLTEVKNVRVMFISQGNIIGEKVYTLNQKEIETPDLNDKKSKLMGWYTDSSYKQAVSNLDDLLVDTYGAEFRNGQLFVYVYAKTEAVSGFNFNNNKLIIIGVIIAVTIGVGYIIINEQKDKKKKKGNSGNRVTWHT